MLFALFRDVRRYSDGHDPLHGERGAALAHQLNGEVVNATEEQIALLVEVCTEHTSGKVSSDQTIGVCWDAERLDLPRCRIQPDPQYLSTEAAKVQATASIR